MNILHVTPHLGGGVGKVILNWVTHVPKFTHSVMCLDYANEWAKEAQRKQPFTLYEMGAVNYDATRRLMGDADIVVCHYWDHRTLVDLFGDQLPPVRLAFWCHKNYEVESKEICYPDRWVDTSPIQGHGFHIWSVGDMEKFFAVKPKEHRGFNIGYDPP